MIISIYFVYPKSRIKLAISCHTSRNIQYTERAHECDVIIKHFVETGMSMSKELFDDCTLIPIIIIK